MTEHSLAPSIYAGPSGGRRNTLRRFDHRKAIGVSFLFLRVLRFFVGERLDEFAVFLRIKFL